MSVMEQIAEAEKNAALAKEQAALEAKEYQKQTEADANAQIAALEQKVAEEIKKLEMDADAQIAANANEISEQCKTTCQSIEENAANKQKEAIDVILRRAKE